ncbi:hypothetical protein ECC02_004072 [Trypanosoma cruzi]|uniref:Protein kinase domain-containing protein n=1 Tax=Trypanosoma cruzi TaxID=5693 RepID=A0A7J6Y7J0_TRYCR|nr:hypothetical protein ECC02_004072 [Trypanosoma cruzi]
MGFTHSSREYGHKRCVKCLRSGSMLQPVTPCVNCQQYLCVHCSKPLLPEACTFRWPFWFGAIPNPRASRCCFSCRSPLLSLDDSILCYIMLFLTYKNQDSLLRVCTRFHSVLFLPYEYVKKLEEKYLWKDPDDILYASRRSIILRGMDRLTNATYALKLIPKFRMLSRRLCQRLQQSIDIRIAASAFPASFASFHNVFHTRDFIVIVLELLPPDKYQSLSALIHSVTLTETECRSIIACVLEGVRCLHDELQVVHRDLSLDAIYVARDNFEDIRLLHFHNARFLKPSPRSSYLHEMWKQQQQQQQQQQQYHKQPLPFSYHSASPEVDDGDTAVALSPQVRQLSKPPPLFIPVDVGLLRKAWFYSKVAREREAQLREAAVRSQGFFHSRFETLRHSGFFPCKSTNPGVAPSGMADEISATASGSPLHSPRSGMTVEPSGIQGSNASGANNNNNNGDDDFVVVATPRAAVGYCAPELSASLCARSLVPTLNIRAGDVKKWDVFAIGGIFYQLLASSTGYFSDAHYFMDWNKVTATITSESLVLLILLMHMEPNNRMTCKEALQIMCEQFRGYVAAGA